MTLRCEVCEKLIFLCKCEIGNGSYRQGTGMVKNFARAIEKAHGIGVDNE